MLLDEQIVAIERGFSEAGIPHAFGGAQALAYYGNVRATHDIDVNVFLPSSEGPRVLAVLGQLGAATSNPGLQTLIARDGQAASTGMGRPSISSSPTTPSTRARPDAGAGSTSAGMRSTSSAPRT
jgi:hypothetical protein